MGVLRLKCHALFFDLKVWDIQSLRAKQTMIHSINVSILITILSNTQSQYQELEGDGAVLGPVASQQDVCMFSSCLCEFYLGSVVSSHNPKTYTLN